MHIGSRPTLAQIDLGKLRTNFRSCRAFIGPEIIYLAVVKADAYGHGASQCSLALEAEGVKWFGVATPEEGIDLRKAGVAARILSLGSFWAGQESSLIDHGITPVIFEIEKAAAIDAAARSAGVRFPVHIKMDTGMGRLGFPWVDAAAIADRLTHFDHIDVEGIMTHYAAADDLMEDSFTKMQTDRFQECLDAFHAAGISPRLADISNSPGSIVKGPSGGNMVRLGGVLYGLAGDILPHGVDKPDLQPILSLRSEISHIKSLPSGHSVGYGRTFIATRDSRIASIPIGYYDGYRRELSNAAYVIVAGKKAPIVGRVSMDWITVDVTDIASASLGDQVTLIGNQGGLEIRVEDLARIAGTISYEITCGISRRVLRHYVGDRTKPVS
jgi:alanine racemase